MGHSYTHTSCALPARWPLTRMSSNSCLARSLWACFCSLHVTVAECASLSATCSRRNPSFTHSATRTRLLLPVQTYDVPEHAYFVEGGVPESQPAWKGPTHSSACQDYTSRTAGRKIKVSRRVVPYPPRAIGVSTKATNSIVASTATMKSSCVLVLGLAFRRASASAAALKRPRASRRTPSS